MFYFITKEVNKFLKLLNYCFFISISGKNNYFDDKAILIQISRLSDLMGFSKTFQMVNLKLIFFLKMLQHIPRLRQILICFLNHKCCLPQIIRDHQYYHNSFIVIVIKNKVNSRQKSNFDSIGSIGSVGSILFFIAVL